MANGIEEDVFGAGAFDLPPLGAEEDGTVMPTIETEPAPTDAPPFAFQTPLSELESGMVGGVQYGAVGGPESLTIAPGTVGETVQRIRQLRASLEEQQTAQRAAPQAAAARPTKTEAAPAQTGQAIQQPPIEEVAIEKKARAQQIFGARYEFDLQEAKTQRQTEVLANPELDSLSAEEKSVAADKVAREAQAVLGKPPGTRLHRASIERATLEGRDPTKVAPIHIVTQYKAWKDRETKLVKQLVEGARYEQERTTRQKLREAQLATIEDKLANKALNRTEYKARNAGPAITPTQAGAAWKAGGNISPPQFSVVAGKAGWESEDYGMMQAWNNMGPDDKKEFETKETTAGQLSAADTNKMRAVYRSTEGSMSAKLNAAVSHLPQESRASAKALAFQMYKKDVEGIAEAGQGVWSTTLRDAETGKGEHVEWAQEKLGLQQQGMLEFLVGDDLNSARGMTEKATRETLQSKIYKEFEEDSAGLSVFEAFADDQNHPIGQLFMAAQFAVNSYKNSAAAADAKVDQQLQIRSAQSASKIESFHNQGYAFQMVPNNPRVTAQIAKIDQALAIGPAPEVDAQLRTQRAALVSQQTYRPGNITDVGVVETNVGLMAVKDVWEQQARILQNPDLGIRPEALAPRIAFVKEKTAETDKRIEEQVAADELDAKEHQGWYQKWFGGGGGEEEVAPTEPVAEEKAKKETRPTYASEAEATAAAERGEISDQQKIIIGGKEHKYTAPSEQ